MAHTQSLEDMRSELIIQLNQISSLQQVKNLLIRQVNQGYSPDTLRETMDRLGKVNRAIRNRY